MSLNNPELAGLMRSASMEAFEKLIGLCLSKAVDFLLVAGDVYDGADRSLRAQVKFRNGLKKLDDAGIRTFVVHGNHDALDTWSTTLDWPGRVHIFKDRIETVSVERQGAVLSQIQGISYPQREERRNLSLLFGRKGPGFQIGLLHANVGSDTGHEPYAPCSVEDLQKSGLDFWALGHVHRRKVVYEGSQWAVYPGNTQGRNVRETGEKGCALVTVADDGDVAVEFHETGTVRWGVHDLSIRNLVSEQDLLKALDRLCRETSESGSGSPTILRLVLSGSGPLYGFLQKPGSLPDLLEIVHETGMSYSPFVWVEQIQTRVSPGQDMEVLRQGRDFLGELLRSSMDLVENKEFEGIIRGEISPLFDDPRFRRFGEVPDTRELKELVREAEGICAEGLQGEDID
jgi:DNA repair exonuclease SbcCD nuclease subunit